MSSAGMLLTHHRTSSDTTPVLSLNEGMKPAEFVERFGGKRVITKVVFLEQRVNGFFMSFSTQVLIANNGIAAVKCMRSIRRWAYELFKADREIRFVAMVTPEDLKANAGRSSQREAGFSQLASCFSELAKCFSELARFSS